MLTIVMVMQISIKRIPTVNILRIPLADSNVKEIWLLQK